MASGSASGDKVLDPSIQKEKSGGQYSNYSGGNTRRKHKKSRQLLAEKDNKINELEKAVALLQKRFQNSEMELSLRAAFFRRQLAVEQKKTKEAQSISAKLRLEVYSLKQKLKERDRGLGITNIYANRMQKGQRERAKTSSSPKGSQSEDICPRVEESIQNENRGRSKHRREKQGSDLLEAELKELKTEPVEKEEDKAEKEAKETLSDILTPVIERHRTTSTSQKQYVFSEAIQNLHQGSPSTGPKVPCSGRRRNRQEGGRADFMGDSVNSYEPSFAKFPQEKQKDTPSTPTEETSPEISPEKKRLVLEILFGPNRVFSSTDSNSHLSTEGHGKKPLPREKKHIDEV